MTSLIPFVKRSAKGKRLPIVLSAPHVGTSIPESIRQQLNPSAQVLGDTDWLIDELYGFAPEIGITLIAATYSRCVVDLNRPSEGPPLYRDARRQTDVVPLTDFDGVSLYPSDRKLPEGEREQRLALYYRPYHAALQESLQELKAEFSDVLLFDAHSIRRHVPSLHPDPFPDLIVGDRDGSSAGLGLTDILYSVLDKSSAYSVSRNHPFKGGHITRHFGRPELGVHALQLEMSQDIYLNEAALTLDSQKAPLVQEVLRRALLELANKLLQQRG